MILRYPLMYMLLHCWRWRFPHIQACSSANQAGFLKWTLAIGKKNFSDIVWKFVSYACPSLSNPEACCWYQEQSPLLRKNEELEKRLCIQPAYKKRIQRWTVKEEEKKRTWCFWLKITMVLKGKFTKQQIFVEILSSVSTDFCWFFFCWI